MLKLLFLLALNSAFAFASADPLVQDAVIVVDKKTNTLHLTNYNGGKLDIIKSFHATLGKKVGDKLSEGDLKTPEGIYDFLYRKNAPQLKPIFGPLAIYIGYPNPMDKTGSKNGSAIFIHGTDNPSRLAKDFDSQGCVVLDNSNVQEVAEYIKLNDTKIIITRDSTQVTQSPRLERAKTFLTTWLNAWSQKDIETYVDSYADEFRSDGMDRVKYAHYKNGLNQKYDTISITAKNPHFYFHEKYDLAVFDQVYKSTFKGGVPAYNGTSRKKLYMQERNGAYKIVMEQSHK